MPIKIKVNISTISNSKIVKPLFLPLSLIEIKHMGYLVN